MATLSLWQLVALVIKCIVVEFQDFYAKRKCHYGAWLRRNKTFALLPLELVAEIVESLECDEIDQKESSIFRQRTLSSCARTSRALAKYSQRQLLRQPYLSHRLNIFEETLSRRNVEYIEHITFDLRDDTIPSVESNSAARIVSMLTSPTTKSIGLMEVRKVGIRELSTVPQLERLHIHMMNYASQFSRHSLYNLPIPYGPFYTLTTLSLSAIHLPYPTGDSSPVSELYTPEMLPNLTSLEIDECCVRVVSKVNGFPFLRYLAIRCSCTRCIPELHLERSLFEPLELFELNPHPYFLEYFRFFPQRLPPFKRLRVSPEFMRFNSEKTAMWIMQILIDGLRDKPSSPLRHLVHVYLPKSWIEYEFEEVKTCCFELTELGKQQGVKVTFDVKDEGTRMNRATRSACFTSDFWKLVEGLKSEAKMLKVRG
ncbi:hypothetical protein JCM3765_001704 [Sporobolomyces pararoseus]